jgi:hypothetical protein
MGAEVTTQSKASKVVLAAVILVGTILGFGSSAYAMNFKFVNTNNPIPAGLEYYSSLQTHTAVWVTGCQNPTFSMRLRETTSGGATVRSISGNCSLDLFLQFPADQSVRVRCKNNESSAKYANCWQQYQ